MKNNLTELVFILDRSGSMSGLEDDTIGGFNSLIEKQKKQDAPCYVTTVFFDSVSETIHDRLPLEKIAPMSDKDYSVRGCTALLDTIGETMDHIETIHKYARPEDVPEHTTFVIMKRIEQKTKEGWEFLFLAANIDAVQTASHFGIHADRAVDYKADSQGTKVAYEAVAEAMCSIRLGKGVPENWSVPVQADYKKRK